VAHSPTLGACAAPQQVFTYANYSCGIEGVEPKNRLGRYRWVVERTLSCLNRFRRLKIRYEHRADIHLAFLQLGCALISLRFLG
jgi:DDE family transposase